VVQRSPVNVRDALPEDASGLLDAWFESCGGSANADEAPRGQQVVAAVARILAEPAERLVVGVVDDQVAGVAYLRRAAITPIHDDDAVHVSHLYVRRAFRRRGVTKALLGEAALWSEEKDSRHVMVMAAARSRDFHRFLARLGLAQVAVVRGSTTANLRMRLAAAQTSSGVAPVVVTRRSLRRRRAVLSDLPRQPAPADR
jgi:GNAT superfamily N-acetyltransferase